LNIRRRIVVNLHALVNSKVLFLFFITFLKIGIRCFVQHEEIIFVVSLLLNSSDPYLITKICSLFAALCRFSQDSKKSVLDCLKYYDQVFRSNNRYERLMEILKTQANQTAKAKVLMLINQLIVDDRAKAHFVQLGLLSYVTVCEI
jgi:hypothetical protein